MKLSKDENKYLLIFLLSILIFIISWVLLNDTKAYSRDEMYYASYSLAWSDADTQDVRHITRYDLYKIAMLPAYRVLLYSSLSLFGKNLVGLRFINLIAGIAILFSVYWFGRKLKLPTSYYLLIYLSLLVVPKMIYYYHLARPDFILMALIIWVFILLIVYTRDKKDYFLYIAAALTGFSCGIYWNGIALVAAFGVIIFYFLLRKVISKRTFLFSVLITSVSLLLFFILPIILNWDVFIPLLTSTGFQTKDISEGTAVWNYPLSLARLVWFGFTNGVLILHGIFLLSTIGLAIFFFTRKNSVEAKSLIKDISIFGGIFIIIYILITAFRGDGEGRFIDHIIILVFVQFSIVFSFTLKNIKKIPAKILALSFLILFFGSMAGKVLYDAYTHNGQAKAYTQYSDDLKNLIKRKDKRVFTSYETMWALPNPKMYLEVFMHKKIFTYEEMSELFKKYNVGYILLDERSKDRMKLGQPSYVNWRKVLDNEYILIGKIANKYYRANKGKNPATGNKFITEVWQRK